MLFIFSVLALIRHVWQLKTVVFLHWCLIHVVLLHGTRYFRGPPWLNESTLTGLPQAMLSYNANSLYIMHYLQMDTQPSCQTTSAEGPREPFSLSQCFIGSAWTQTLNLVLVRRVFYHCAAASGNLYACLVLNWQAWQFNA